MDVSNKNLVILLVGIIVVSLAGTILTVMRYSDFNSNILTGHASSSGTTNLTITTTTSITFANASLDLGTGAVSAGYLNCSIQVLNNITKGTGCSSGFGSSTTAGPLVIENNGNINLNVTLQSNASASTMIGGTTPILKWRIDENETSSCRNLTVIYSTFWPNQTWVDVAANTSVICANLSYVDADDSLKLSFNLTIPYDATIGSKVLALTVTGV